MINSSNIYDVIIVGGSYSGLSAAMSLGRALRRVLVIDSGQPCNAQTPHAHNLLLHDGQAPAQIAEAARAQVAKYDTVQFHSGLAVSGIKTGSGFELTTAAGNTFAAKKILFATGLKDIMPGIEGFAACWGISVLHCPYCHGYEVKGETTGIIGNGEAAFHYVQLIYNWSKDLVLFTNGPNSMTAEQTEKARKHNIKIIETEIDHIAHEQGKIKHIALKDNTKVVVAAAYSRPVLEQRCSIPAALGCEITEQGQIKTDAFQKTSVAGVFASGDNVTFGRSLAMAISSGSVAGAFINGELCGEAFSL